MSAGSVANHPMIALSLVVYVVPGAHGFLWGILNRVEPLISQFPEAKQNLLLMKRVLKAMGAGEPAS